MANSVPYLKGSFSLVVMSPKKLLAVRDPWGFRPLCFGKTEHSYIFSSETCGLDAVDAKYICDLRPEIITVDKDEVRHDARHCSDKEKCVFLNMCILQDLTAS